MNKYKQFSKKLRKKLLKFAMGCAILGLLIGGFFSIELFGQKEKNIQMGRFEFSIIEINKTSRILQSIDNSIKGEELKNATIEWLMYKESYVGLANKLNLKISDQEISDFIKDIDSFKNEDGSFSKQKYDSYLQANVVEPSFYEKIVRDEIITQKIRNLISTELFKTEDLNNLENKINREYKTLILLADTRKISDYAYNDEFYSFISDNENYLNLTVTVKTIDAPNIKNEGQFNVLKRSETKIEETINNHTIKTKKISVKQANSITNQTVLNTQKYYYDEEGKFYVISFDSLEKAEKVTEALKTDYQFLKKSIFLEQYIKSMTKKGKSLEEIKKSQSYFSTKKQTTNFYQPFINRNGRSRLANSSVGDVIYLKSNPFYTAVEILEIGPNKAINRKDFEKYYTENMNKMFLNILDKEAIESF